MHHGADDEPPHPVLAAVSVVFGALFGLAFGIGGFFIATAVPLILRTALPSMPDPVFLALWAVSEAVPAVAFGRAFRLGRDRGARAFAGCGLAMLLVLFAGELTGTISVYPWHTRFYVVPAPIDRGSSQR